MRVESIDVQGLHGFIDHQLRFNDGINLLVGINGSGKTSILNLVNWILRPRVESLCAIKFDSIVLKYAHGKDKAKVTCSQREDQFMYELSVNGRQYNPLRVAIRPVMRRESAGNVDILRPEAKERKTWKYVRNQPSPIVIEVDRRLQADSPVRRVRIDEEGYEVRDESVPSSIEQVRRTIRLQLSSYNKNVLDMNRELRDQIILSAFRPSDVSGKLDQQQVAAELPGLQQKALEYVRKYVSKERGITTDVGLYFTNLQKLVAGMAINTIEIDPRAASLCLEQYHRVKDLLATFEDYERKAQEAFSPLERFFSLLNRFFRDSGKSLRYRERSNELCFDVITKADAYLAKDQEIDLLSSGEKQLLILLSQLAFNNENMLYLVDEPEISLHPRWQEDFLDAVQQVLSPSSQLLMATHSPAIVGHHKDLCQILAPVGNKRG